MKEWLADEIVERCLYVPQNGLMLGKMSGTRYASQYYLSNVLYDANTLDKIAVEAIWQIEAAGLNIEKIQICGREWSSIPIITALNAYIDGAFMIRRERKNYGRHNYIEGIPSNKPVLIVDDLCNSTNSFHHCKQVLDSEGLETVPFIFAVLNKYRSKDEGFEYDRYLGSSHKALSIVTGDDIDAAKRRRKNKAPD